MRICAEKCTMTRQSRSKSTERDRGLRPERFMALVTFRQIRYFIAVAESGKISAAASMLGISPSVVTEAVSELETLSRMKLFQRQPRGLDLTYEGHRFLAHCRNILSAIEGANDALARPDSEMEGTLKLATTITVAGYFLAPLLSRFQKTFPNIQVQVVEEKRLGVEAGVIEGKHDLALIAGFQSFQSPKALEPHPRSFDAPALAAAKTSAAQSGNHHTRRR